ncbi:uncharacterized protein LOC113280465 [Papaver somniferum]|uniref:uncharacterized protein LOC113280465 n=1 Tax=Papaver somniferum TaxID=3469 RepID=UPI000E6F5107|nr:uncharacterized protein LOC113280465 [Papaver somniferum]
MDRNTKYHHANENKRRTRNNIVALIDGNGNWCTSREELENLLIDHCSSLHTSTVPDRNDDIISCIPSLINSADNMELMRVLDNIEMHRSLKDMKPWKAPGPDGIPPGFFQHHWEIVGNDVVEMVKQFFQTGYLLKSLNATNISLIPKTKNEQFPSDLRPISLCNSSYKIISKITSKRLKKIMGKVIPPLQAAYVQGRQITDNIHLAQEIVHSMKNKKEVNKYLALKLDMSKAFDRLEWSFLRDVMLKLGFYDCLLFINADLHNVNNILKIIEDFGAASGQMVNFGKSSVYYSANVPQRFCRILTRRLKVPRMNSNERYLGIPLIIGKNKVNCFTGLVERVKNRLFNWNSESMSQCSKSLMIRTVTNTIPAYTMGCLEIPSEIIKQIDNLQRKFWWGFQKNNGICITSWKKLGLHKYFGGQGFRDLKLLNQALLIRAVWRMCINSEEKWVKAMQAKYYPGTHILLANLKTNFSWSWRGLRK